MTAESERPPVKPERHRADPALFAAGLTTAIAGGVTVNVGGALMFIGSDPCMMGPHCSKNEDEEMQTSGAILMLAGVAMIASGIPMAVVGGKKVPVTTTASGLALTF